MEFDNVNRRPACSVAMIETEAFSPARHAIMTEFEHAARSSLDALQRALQNANAISWTR